MNLESVHYTTFVLMCVASAGLWFYYIARQSKGDPLLPTQYRDASPLGMVDVIIAFAGAMIFAQVIGGGILSWMGIDVFHPKKLSLTDSSKMMIGLYGTQLIAIFVCLGILYVRYGRLSAIGIQKNQFWRDVKVGCLGFLFLIPPVLLVQNLVSRYIATYEHSTLETLSESQSMLPILATWFSAVLVAPVVEEIFFRGILQNWLQRLGNTEPEQFNHLILGGDFSASPAPSVKPREIPSNEAGAPDNLGGKQPVQFDSRLRWAPIIVASLLFAASHIGQGAAPIPLFCLSIGLGFLYRQTASIIPCIIVHLLLNFYTMLWATLAMAQSQ